MRRSISLVAVLLLTLGLAACDDTDAPTIAGEDLGASPEAVEVDDPTEEASSEPEEPEGPEEPEPTATEETATEEPTPAPPTFEEVCAGRDDEAFIEVLTPASEAEVGDPFTATGCGNTFEASYIWRLERPDGSVVADGFGQMSCGNGCVGEFEQEVEVGETGDFTLVVFESSAQDGSEQHVVEVPVTVTG